VQGQSEVALSGPENVQSIWGHELKNKPSLATKNVEDEASRGCNKDRIGRSRDCRTSGDDNDDDDGGGGDGGGLDECESAVTRRLMNANGGKEEQIFCLQTKGPECVCQQLLLAGHETTDQQKAPNQGQSNCH
jgi:hypothetical protein